MLYRKILVAFDGSEGAWKALRKAIALAREGDAELTALSVEGGLPRYPGTIDEVAEAKEERDAHFARLHNEAVALAWEEGVAMRTEVVLGLPARSIVSYAQEHGYDLIVIGQAGHSGAWGTLLGAVTDRVVEHSHCDVLVVRAIPEGKAKGERGRAVEDFGARVQVEDVMTRDVTTVGPETSLREAVELLVAGGHRALPVVDRDRRVVGIVTNGDLVERGGLRLRVELLRSLTPAALAEEVDALEEGKTVANVMTREVVTISPKATLAEAAHLMVARRLKRLPVVDSAGVLLGLVSRLDLLRTRSEAPIQPPFEEAPVRNGQTIGEVMRTDIPTVGRTAPLAEVLDAVISTRLNRALVLDADGRVVGGVTDAELTRRLSPRDHPSLAQVLMSRLPFASLSPEQRRDLAQATGTTAEELMIPNVATVRADTPIGEAIAVMLRDRRKLLPVVDERGRLLGAVDRSDLLRLLVIPKAKPEG